MANPFLLYRLVRAGRIVKSNIRPNYIKKDLNDLIRCLNLLENLSESTIPDGSSLDEDIFESLSAKPDTLSLLVHFGYECNDDDKYIYHSPRSERDRESRRNGMNDFEQFLNDLRSAQDGSLDGFEQFIRNDKKHSSSENNYKSDDQKVHRRSSFKPSPLRYQYGVEKGNEKTLEVVKALQKSLVTKFDSTPPPNFTRRKLAFQVFKQTYPDASEAGDENIDMTIDQKIRSLKEKEKQTHVVRTDEIYVECLIRSEFNEDEALNMLRYNRPNLTIRNEQPSPNPGTKISLTDSADPLNKHWRLLIQYKEPNIYVRQPSSDRDEWKNAKHLIPAIQQLRQKTNAENVDEASSFSKMYRLLYSELSRITGRQLPVKIEQLASLLCELPIDSVENLDIVTIKDILRSSGELQVHDNFQSHAMKSLSIMCPICATSFPRSQMETMFLCDHMCCLGCLKGYYRNTIKDIRDHQSLNKLTCFQEAHEITNETSMFFFTYLEAKLNQWFRDDQDILRKYHENVFIVRHDRQVKKCGNPKCVSYVGADGDTIGYVRCPHCKFGQCGQCCRKWLPEHKKMSCEEYQAWLIDNDPDDADVQLVKYLNAAGIECPNPQCKEIFDYQPGGCEHYTCPTCDTQFCRTCPALFYSPEKKTKCPQVNCKLATLHAHCRPNCFRETRIGTIDALSKLLNNHKINVTEELQKNKVSSDKKCTTEGCRKDILKASGDRLCELCYKQLLCSLIWRHELEPWEIYEDNNLRQMLVKESVAVPAKATRQNLIALCIQNLNPLLGKPKKITKPKS